MDGNSADLLKSHNSYFATQSATAEDLLKEETVGLVKLDDFRKRRAEVLERKERGYREGSGRGTPTAGDGSATPTGDRGASPQPGKKKRKAIAKGKLSFGLDAEEDDTLSVTSPRATAISSTSTPRSITPAGDSTDTGAADSDQSVVFRRLGPNTSLTTAPRVMTKSALAKEVHTREQLRKEYLQMQEIVKATDIMIPFVFYDGTNIPGGSCRMKKGEHVWLFLDKARKLGAESGVGGGEKGRKEWARVGVDDLLMVRGEIIIPHHYDFYYFIADKTLGFNGPLFNFSATATTTLSYPSPANTDMPHDYDPMSRPGSKKREKDKRLSDDELEGANDDPNTTKVVDRRWYEKNKHIFPASVWEEFDPKRDYTKGMRKDTEGNGFFFS